MLGATPDSATVMFLTPEGERQVKIPCGLFTTSIWLTRQAAVRGLGPTGLPRRACADLLESGALVELLPGLKIAPTPVRLVYASRKPPLRVKVFVDLVVEAFDAWSAR